MSNRSQTINLVFEDNGFLIDLFGIVLSSIDVIAANVEQRLKTSSAGDELFRVSWCVDQRSQDFYNGTELYYFLHLKRFDLSFLVAEDNESSCGMPPFNI